MDLDVEDAGKVIGREKIYRLIIYEAINHIGVRFALPVAGKCAGQSAHRFEGGWKDIRSGCGCSYDTIRIIFIRDPPGQEDHKA
jgi:hypothetical protein